MKIPAFDGTNNKYRDYRRQVKKVHSISGKGGHWFSSSVELVWRGPLEVTRHLKPRKLKAKGGVRLLLDALDDEYRGMEEDRLDEAAEAFIQCRKLANEPMTRYIAGFAKFVGSWKRKMRTCTSPRSSLAGFC